METNFFIKKRRLSDNCRQNKGYLLQNKGQILDQATLSTLLNDTPLKEIKVVKQISSTNKVLKQQIDKDGYQHDALLIANFQTDGV
ncbi:MAG: hypothetical protein IKV38_02880, partial [Clostridia bacterium]|nr:hypothetical protein [Clostridia bacterium]